jgi:hypothetical protein
LIQRLLVEGDLCVLELEHELQDLGVLSLGRRPERIAESEPSAEERQPGDDARERRLAEDCPARRCLSRRVVLASPDFGASKPHCSPNQRSAEPQTPASFLPLVSFENKYRVCGSAKTPQMVGFSEFLVLGEIPFRIRAGQVADAPAPFWRHVRDSLAERHP